MLWLWRTEGRRRVAVEEGEGGRLAGMRVGGSSWPFSIETGMFTEVRIGMRMRVGQDRE